MVRLFPRRPARPQTGYACNGTVRIYFERHGQGAPLLLHHGFGGASSSWTDAGYVTRLISSRMVILLDARGHGRSDAPTDANAYSVEHRVSDIAAVMDEVNLETTDYWGYSMGGTIGFHLAQTQPDRVGRVVAGAASSRPGETYAERCLARAAAFRTKDPAAIAEMGEMSEDLSARFVATNNMEALAALQEAWATWKGVDLPSIKAPLFQYCGEQDTALLREIRHTVNAMPIGRFAQLDDCDHLTAFLRVKVAMAAVMPFLDVAGRGAAQL